jgi:hypothetical protein
MRSDLVNARVAADMPACGIVAERFERSAYRQFVLMGLLPSTADA